jgi:2-polyprenyl-3-methyl-5-hydroxy-6-metoxy-1,4-benzoquinol methylase
MNAPLPAYFNYSRPEVVARFDPKGLRILDVGCAAGAMGAEMLAKGALEVVGLEREARAAAIARTRLSSVLQVDLDSRPTLPFPDAFFDVITCADVLEHLVDPGALLTHLRRYLKDDGLLVCSIPNVRHESVLVPLLVSGRFHYADAGILDRTHLRFFTITEFAGFLAQAGFTMEEQVDAVSSKPSPQLEVLEKSVKKLGGDQAAFRAEAAVIQYLTRAKPAKSGADLGLTPSPVPRRALADQWAGSKNVRVLLAPDPLDPADPWLTVVTELLADKARAAQITIGIAVEARHLETPPPAFQTLAQAARGADLLLTEAPTEPFAWERLLAGATLFIDTANRSALTQLARKVGVEVNLRSKAGAALAPPSGGKAHALFLALMKKALLNTLYEDAQLTGAKTFDAKKREVGLDWPSQAHTMIGRKRLDHLQFALETVLAEGVPGDVIETGVWRGGATIFMRAILQAWGVTDRRVFVADSFAGLPPPDPKYAADQGDQHHTMKELAISLEQVRANFAKYDLLDEQVVFLEGWFKDTLPAAPLQQLAIARLDGDMYGSTMDAIEVLYPKLSVGGFLIVDDYGAVVGCRKAIEDYRQAHGITEPMSAIDWTGAYWRKAR